MDVMRDMSSSERHVMWAVILIVSNILASGVFACATPFAGLAALVALDSDKRNGLILIGLVWLADQMVGFVFLGYPHEVQAYAWGIAIGLGAIAAFLAARSFVAAFIAHSLTATVVGAFAVAFAVYQLVLYAATFVLGGSGAFSFKIVFYVGLVNAIGFVVLIIAHFIAMAAGLVDRNRVEERTSFSA